MNEPAVKSATARGEGSAVGVATWANAVPCNGLGRYEDALTAGRQLVDFDDPDQRFVSQWGAAEPIEAAVRAGTRDAAADTLSWFAPLLRATRTEFALGVQARSRALLADGPAAEDAYRDAIEHLCHTRRRPELAWAHLVYGEWLHRERRRGDARGQLRTALDQFTTMGMAGFAERAARALHATGATVRTRPPNPSARSPPQEAQIARLVQDSQTNPEIAARLFLSPRTVESHLARIYDKLRSPPRPLEPPSPPAP
ncbi:helix-turn-helix transcriptional regulator [Amycolatopsis sp. NPDC049253]|uniref:helix-turn-helix transcriptional regulator n=1 Tax=Amycolatopsis sp. NPDC049253 TaxID=3155274 RepID=UPI003429B903